MTMYKPQHERTVEDWDIMFVRMAQRQLPANGPVCDAAQEAWVHVLKYSQGKPQFTSACALWGIKKYIQKEQNRVDLAPRINDEPWYDPRSEVETRDLLEYIFRNVKLNCREWAILEGYLEGRDYADLARQLNTTAATINSTFQYIMRKMRKVLKK